MQEEKDPTISETYQRLGISFNSFYSKSEAMNSCLEALQRVAPTDLTILILGENGTGKNLLAQATHNASERVENPYIAVNCSALGENLIESELFGHEKGSFTGADKTRKGKFELADKGTIFLDEIADMSHSAQAKVLRIVEYKEFERLGGENTLHTDVRIIAATNKDIISLVNKEIFRRDLYHRLSEVVVELPSLRERLEDIPIIIEESLADFNRKFKMKVRKVSDEVMNFFLQYPWPGNVRELRNVIRSAVALSKSDTITFEELKHTGLMLEESENSGSKNDLTISSAEKEQILKVLKITGGNKKKAAEILGVSYATLKRRVSEYDL